MSVHLKAGNNTGTNLEIVPTTTKKIQSKVKHPQNVINQTLHFTFIINENKKLNLNIFRKPITRSEEIPVGSYWFQCLVCIEFLDSTIPSDTND